ncbi:MAG TPA: peptidoglycan-associated lipoprotein Pal [Candidatus Angelobacter sp.]
MTRTLKSSIGIVAFAGALLLTSCSAKKQTPVTTKQTPPPPTAPTATLSASPNVIQQGQSTQLTWQTTNATDITIAGLGTVEASGSRSVAPGSSTTYTLTAKGAGGSQDASARVTVNPVTATAPPVTRQELSIKDVFFDYDKALIRDDAQPVTQNDASYLLQHPEVSVTIEGHCDDRGSTEYNLALGASRAASVKDALQRQGVDASRLKTISYGKEKPFCNQDNEECWQENRRDHFVAQH